MPTVAVVFGIAVLFFYNDHDPPHFHVQGGAFQAKIDLADLSASEVKGHLRPQDLNRIRAWATRHRAELWENWMRARRREPLVKIED